MTEKTFSGNVIARTFTFKDEADALFDPDTVTICFLDPNGATVATQAIGDLTRLSLGLYQMVYTLPVGCAVGVWNIQLTVTYGSLVNEEFFPFTVEAAPTAPYAVVDSVKYILTITDSDGSKYDDELADCIVSSTAFVNSLLLQKGLTAPTPTPQNIIDATNYFAAYMFRKRRDPQSAWIFYLDAEKFLNAYIDSTPDTSGSTQPFAVGTINIDDNRVEDSWY